MSGNTHSASVWYRNGIISRCCGSFVCEPVQEQIGQVLAKIWALKAELYQPFITINK